MTKRNEERLVRTKRGNGEGTWIPLKNGKMDYRKMVGYLPNGNKKYITARGASKAECLRRWESKYQEYLGKTLNEEKVKKMSFLELCQMKQRDDKEKIGKLRDGTLKRNACTIRNQIEGHPIGYIQVYSLNANDIEEHIKTLVLEGLSVSTVEKTLYIINKTLRWAKNKRLIKENPCEEVKEDIYEWLNKIRLNKKSVGTVQVLSEKQISDIRKIVDSRKNEPAHRYIFALSVLLLLYTGMRVGELCALRWGDWSSSNSILSILRTTSRRDKEEGEIGTTKKENEIKNCHSRSIALNHEAYIILNELYNITPKKDKNDSILLNKSYKSTCSSDYDAKLIRFYRDCGFSDSISGAHILRRTCATDMYRNGSRLEEIAAYLGDSPETIRKHYLCITEKIISEGEVMNVVAYPRSNPTLSD